MQIYKNGVYKSCTPTLYDSKFKSLGFIIVDSPEPETEPEPVTTETASPIVEEMQTAPRPKARPRKGRK